MAKGAGLKTSIAVAFVAVLFLSAMVWVGAGAANSRPSPKALEELGLRTSAAQDAALVDGVVSEDEYHAAIASARTCIVEKGVVLAPAQELSAEITALTAESAKSGEEVSDIVTGCLDVHLSWVSLAWASQQPRVDPGSQAFLAAFTACLVSHGISEGEILASGVTLRSGVLAGPDEIVKLADELAPEARVAALRPCQREFPAVFLIAGDP